MKLTIEQIRKDMLPRKNETVGSYQIPITTKQNGNPIAEWHNPDDQINVRFDSASDELTGTYYNWDDTAQNWVDGESMTDADLTERITRREFLLM